jgi:hypothetical protein
VNSCTTWDYCHMLNPAPECHLQNDYSIQRDIPGQRLWLPMERLCPTLPFSPAQVPKPTMTNIHTNSSLRTRFQAEFVDRRHSREGAHHHIQLQVLCV